MRENWISNRIFASYGDILDHCCDAWNKLTDRPWLIMSIGLRDLGQVQIHARSGAAGQNQARALALSRADRPEDVGRGCPLVLGG